MTEKQYELAGPLILRISQLRDWIVSWEQHDPPSIQLALHKQVSWNSIEEGLAIDIKELVLKNLNDRLKDAEFSLSQI